MGRTTLEQVKKWVQHRIDYWEDIIDKYPKDGNMYLEEILEMREEKGMLEAYYMVMECINSERK